MASMSPLDPLDASLSALTRKQEREELAHVLAIPEISRSTNLVRLLSFICEKYFEGKTEEIRESTIAIKALGRREAGFDSQADPIVRVTARMLRKRLEEYYQNGGRSHPVHLNLPVGHYVPRFVRCENGSTWQLHSPDHPAAGDSEEFHASSSSPFHSPGRTDAIPDPGYDTSTETILPSSADVRPFPAVSARPRKRRMQSWMSLGAKVLGVLAACVLSFWVGRQTDVQNEPVMKPADIWGNPVWSEEFNGAAGAAIDESQWTFGAGNNGGWGNHEMEFYCAPGTPSPCDAHNPNAYQDGNGHLVIRAIQGKHGSWTSARLKTRGLKDFRYGRVEARIKLPVGAGLWPAFWMIGENFKTLGWPACGSVSVMENVASLGPGTIRASIQGPGYSGGNGMSQNIALPNGGRIDDDNYHIYGAILSPNMIQFYVDDPNNVYFVRTASDVPQGTPWVFNHPFLPVLNLAVGGDWPGPADNTTPNPSEMLVDYVRVYQASRVPGPLMSASPITVKPGDVGTSTIRLRSTHGGGRVYLSCSGGPVNSTCSLNTAVVDFTHAATQTAILTIVTKSSPGASGFESTPGRYTLKVAASSVSGDTSTLDIPLRVK